MLKNFGLRFKTVAGIELGGQTAAVAISNQIGKFIYKKKGIPTRDPRNPKDSISDIVSAIKSQNKKIDAIGIASFGPISIPEGKIVNTPKQNWRNFPVVKYVQESFPGVPITFDTDVNAPAMCEYFQLKKKYPNIKSLAYITIGTGVGVGLYADGKTFHGKMHPEFGHLLPMRLNGDNFVGSCPYHKGCYEGIISALAIGKRLNINPGDVKYIANEDKLWDLWIPYVAQLVSSIALAYSTDAVVIGGGIATAKGREHFYPLIAKKTEEYINGYIDKFLVIPPYFGADSGLVGACSLALNE